MLRNAAAVEAASEHPLARAVVEFAASEQSKLPVVTNFDSDPGLGVWGNVEGKRSWSATCASWSGTASMSQRSRARAEEERASGATAVYVAVDRAVAGLLVIADAD